MFFFLPSFFGLVISLLVVVFLSSFSSNVSIFQQYVLSAFPLCLQSQTGMTSVEILDFEHTSYLNFEAEVYYPEDEGILQVYRSIHPSIYPCIHPSIYVFISLSLFLYIYVCLCVSANFVSITVTCKLGGTFRSACERGWCHLVRHVHRSD